MPFKRPWHDYEQGDLIYGMAGGGTDMGVGRNILITKLFSAKKIKADDVYTVDQLGLFQSDTDPRYNVTGLKYDAFFIAVMEIGAKTKVIIDQDLDDDALWTNEPLKTGGIARRKSKGGLEYILNWTDHRIHFCLQSLNLEQVPAKNYVGRRGDLKDSVGGTKDGFAWDQKARLITGSELRWVYRNRAKLAVRRRVQFWDGADPVQCLPPWDDPAQPKAVRSAWAAYHPTVKY